MALWTARRAVYKVGVVVQHLGFLLFVVGFSTPFWFYASPGEGSQGLWQYCIGHCHKLEVEEEWFEAARVLLCLTLIVHLVACVLAVHDNCLKKYDPLTYTPSRRIEITTAAAGLMGACGLSVYTIMMKIHYQEYTKGYFGPAYGITIAGCALALIAAVVLSASGRLLLQNYVTLTTPTGQSVMITYQSTSHASSPHYAGTSAPRRNNTPSMPATSNTPYLYREPSVSSYGYPTEFSNPSSSGYPLSVPVYPGSDHFVPVAKSQPPPYILPSAPSTSSSF